MRACLARLVSATLFIGGLAAAAGPTPAPGTPGFVAAWNRPTVDSVADLDPGAAGDRFELRGRLISPGDATPMAGWLVYVYHADSHGLYADPKFPDLQHKAGVFRSGPGGGYVIRSSMPGMYEGPPHIHMDGDVPGLGRCTWFVSFYPDSASWPLPGTIDLPPLWRAPSGEHKAMLHRDPDGVYRARRTLHVGNWFPQPDLDSLRAAIARRYERAPWRRDRRASTQVPR
jgi:hypothetical protein